MRQRHRSCMPGMMLRWNGGCGLARRRVSDSEDDGSSGSKCLGSDASGKITSAIALSSATAEPQPSPSRLKVSSRSSDRQTDRKFYYRLHRFVGSQTPFSLWWREEGEGSHFGDNLQQPTKHLRKGPRRPLSGIMEAGGAEGGGAQGGPLPCLTNVIKLCEVRSLYCMALAGPDMGLQDAKDAVVSVSTHPPIIIPPSPMIQHLSSPPAWCPAEVPSILCVCKIGDMQAAWSAIETCPSLTLNYPPAGTQAGAAGLPAGLMLARAKGRQGKA